jgi:hypothetical protein
MVVLICTPTSNVQGFPTSSSSLTFVFACFLDACHSDWGEMKSQCLFNCIPLMAEGVKHFFMYLLVFKLLLKTVQFVCSFIVDLFVLLVFNYLNSLYILDINPLSDEYLEKILSHSGFWVVSYF